MKASRLALRGSFLFAFAGVLSACGSSSGSSGGSAACHYVAVGNSGTIACSPDGVSWSDRTSGTGQDLAGVAVSPSGVVVAVGSGGTVLRSSDGAKTFHQATAPIQGNLDAVAVNDAGRFVTGGSDAHTYYSDDGGKSWTASQAIASSGNFLITGLSSVGGKNFLAVTPSHVYLSTDDAASWSAVYSGPAVGLNNYISQALKSVATDGAQHYVTVGGARALYASGNPPSSWTASSGFNKNFLLGGVVWDGSHQQFVAAGYVLSTQGISGGAYASLDEGKSFSQVCTDAGQTTSAAVVVGGGRFVVVGPNSALSSSDGGAHCTLAAFNSGSLATAVAYIP